MHILTSLDYTILRTILSIMFHCIGFTGQWCACVCVYVCAMVRITVASVKPYSVNCLTSEAINKKSHINLVETVETFIFVHIGFSNRRFKASTHTHSIRRAYLHRPVLLFVFHSFGKPRQSF